MEEPLWWDIAKTWLESKNISIHQELQRLKNLVITILPPIPTDSQQGWQNRDLNGKYSRKQSADLRIAIDGKYFKIIKNTFQELIDAGLIENISFDGLKYLNIG